MAHIHTNNSFINIIINELPVLEKAELLVVQPGPALASGTPDLDLGSKKWLLTIFRPFPIETHLQSKSLLHLLKVLHLVLKILCW